MIIGMASAFALFAAATAMHKHAVVQSTAAVLSDNIFSRVESELTTGADLSMIIKTNADASDEGYEGYKYDLELVSVAPDENEIYVKLTIKWQKEGRERHQVFSTILLRHIPFKGRDPYRDKSR